MNSLAAVQGYFFFIKKLNFACVLQSLPLGLFIDTNIPK
jgi:hypothetical protein